MSAAIAAAASAAVTLQTSKKLGKSYVTASARKQAVANFHARQERAAKPLLRRLFSR